MADISVSQFEELRKPFPEGVVGLLPKPTRKDAQKGNCNVCGGYHGLPAVHLDFVGHAAVTDRLLTVDPAWTWEPLALDERGLPALDRDGNLWIRLTVLGVTRLGVGDGPNMKERIGDALRNAAMRFGVALSLWTKDELESGSHEQKAAAGNADEPPRPQTFTAKQAKNRIYQEFRKSGLDEEASKKATEAAWTLGDSTISDDDLSDLIGDLDIDPGRPFEQEAS